MDYIHLTNWINGNKFIVGLAMITMNFGSRYLIMDVTAKQDKLFKSPVFKKVVLFCIFFVGTRDVLMAAMLWMAANFILEVLLNEHKRFNLIGRFFNVDTNKLLYTKYADIHKNLFR